MDKKAFDSFNKSFDEFFSEADAKLQHINEILDKFSWLNHNDDDDDDDDYCDDDVDYCDDDGYCGNYNSFDFYEPDEENVL